MGDKSGSNDGSLRRRPGPPPEEEDEIEEGEIRRGGGYYDSSSETEDDDCRYVFQPRRDEEEEEEGMSPASKRRRLEDILAGSRGALALPSPTPSSGSEGTISDHGDGIGDVAAAAAVAAREAFPCHVCNKEFGSRKAVHGHMRVHQGEKQEKGRPSMHLALGWASTGKRVGNGNSRAVTVAFAPKEEAVDNSRAIVLAVPQPQPMAAAARTEPIHDGEHTTIMVAEANPPNQFVYHDHLPAAAPYVGGANHHVPPQPAAAPVQPLALFPEAAQAGGPYRCKFEGCNMEYKTHQGLGGHVAGHINREKQAAAAAAQGGGNAGGAKPEGNHPCKVCGKEFLTGVALGGHMRAHYNGKVFVNKKNQHLNLSLAAPAPAPAPATAAAALPPAEPMAEVAEHGAAPAPVPVPAPEPAPARGRRNIVRIFGFEVEKPTDAEEQDGGSD